MNINDLYPSRWLKADDIGDEDLALTVNAMTQEEVGQGSDAETKPVLWFDETDKGMVLNKTNAGTIATQFGGETDAWIGKKLRLFVTEVDFGGKQVLAIRVRMPRAPKAGTGRPAPPARVPVGAGAGKSDDAAKWGDDE